MSTNKSNVVDNILEILNLKIKDEHQIQPILKHLSDIFSIDEAFVVEKNLQGELIITASFTNEKQNYELKELKLSFLDFIKQGKIITLDADMSNSFNEESLLSFFNAKQIIGYDIAYDESPMEMILLFVNHEKKEIVEVEWLHRAIIILAKALEVKMYKNKMKFAQTSLESILDNTGIDIYVNDFYTHDILYVNKSMAAPYGGVSEFMGNKCWKVLFPGQDGPCEFCPQKNLIDDEGNPTKVYTWDYQRAFDGSWFRVFSAAFHWVDGRIAHVVSSADITDNKKNEALIEYMANYDSLTNLPNRRMLVKECQNRIINAKNGEVGYLLFFDIDGFKNINDTYGHDAGDEFLIQLGEFFSSNPMLKDSVYRNGGDEFIAIIDGNISKYDLKRLTYFIHERFKKPWKLKKGNIGCNVSIGIACYPEDGTTPEELLLKADQAMYKVKKSGGANVCFVDELKIKM